METIVRCTSVELAAIESPASLPKRMCDVFEGGITGAAKVQDFA